jgi:hypothetical protein
MSSFANLKRNRSSLDKLTKAIEATGTPAEAGGKDDNRFWQPQVDKAGNGMAVIRFLRCFAMGTHLQSRFSRSWWLVH